MGYNKYEVLGIERDNDNDGKPRVRLICKEPEPRTLRLNLSRADAARIASFENLIGQTAMIPCRTGQTDQGMGFLVLEEGEPLAMPPSPSKSVETVKEEVSPKPSLKFGG